MIKYNQDGWAINVVGTPAGLYQLREARIKELADRAKDALTVDKLRGMSRDDINNNWQEVMEVLKYGKE
jgi:hypothetical protein